MISLGFVNNVEFVSRYTEETERYIFPIAEDVNCHMIRELGHLVASRRKALEFFRSVNKCADIADFMYFI
jgi:hypothetical protein